MIHVERLPCPARLAQKQAAWTRSFLQRRLNKPTLRPDHRQYAHPDVLSLLSAMSCNKCFYCERQLTDDERTVDHHLDVADAPEQAFTWTNLYLSCSICQTKLPQRTLANARCVDPCGSDDPDLHLSFHKEVIQGKTDRGTYTIQKYKLGSDGHLLRRLRALNDVYRLVLERHDRPLTPADRRALWQLADPSQPYSSMFRHLLQVAGVPYPM